MGFIGKHNIDSVESSRVSKIYIPSDTKEIDLRTGDLTIRVDGKTGVFLSKEFCKNHSNLLKAWWTSVKSDIYEQGITLYGNSGPYSRLTYLILKKNNDYSSNKSHLRIIQVYTAAISEKELNEILKIDNGQTNKLLYEKIQEIRKKIDLLNKKS